MYTSVLKTVSLGALFAACASALPSPKFDSETINLDNGAVTVPVLHSIPLIPRQGPPSSGGGDFTPIGDPDFVILDVRQGVDSGVSGNTGTGTLAPRQINASPGDEYNTVEVRQGVDSGVSGNTGTGTLAPRQSDTNCKGSAFCERLGSSCDDALRKVIPGNTYSTYDGSQNSGTCSGTCGLFFSGGHCEGTGQELIDAFHAIRDVGNCAHCGQYRRDSDGCYIKIDRVTGC